MTNNIIIANNFFSNEECKDLIELYSLLEHKAVKAEPHRGSELAMYSSKKEFEIDRFKHFRKKLQKNVLNLIGRSDIEPDWAILYKWEENSYQTEHYDHASDRTVLTTVAYLNDGFTGGETYLECGTKISPQKGRLLIFNGNEILHGVNPIIGGQRYSVSMWWKKSL